MVMKLTRLTDLSLNYFLRHELSRQITGGITTTSDQTTYRLKHQNVVMTRPVTVYRNEVAVDTSEFSFYPITGQIVFHTTQNAGDTITADYYYTWVGIADAYVENILEPPFVAVENPGDMGRPYDIGSLAQWVESEFFIHVYARGEGQRDDITDYIKDALSKDCPIWDFNNGFPTDFDGKLNFNWDVNDILGYVFFHVPRVRRNPLQSNDEMERGRALITVSAEYYRA